MAGPDSEKPRAPARLSPGGADPPLLASWEQPRHSPRPARAIEQAGNRRALLGARLPPTTRPAAHRRRRDAEASRRLAHRQPRLARLHKRKTARQSELGVTVKLHPGPSSRSESWQTHSLERGP